MGLTIGSLDHPATGIMLTVLALLCMVASFASHVASDCTPSSDLAWTRNGDTWYAETKRAGSWIHMVYECADVEHPHTTIAHVHDQSTVDHLHTKGDLLNHPHWIAGTKLGRRKSWVWFTYTDASHRDIHPILKYFWAQGEPKDHHDCISHDARTQIGSLNSARLNYTAFANSN